MPVSAATSERSFNKHRPAPLKAGGNSFSSVGSAVDGEAYQRVEEDVDDEDLEVWDDARVSTRPLGTPHSESGLQDVLEDLRSQRWRYFFAVPKVKFVMYVAFHLLHLLLLMAVVFFSSGELRMGLSQQVSIPEYCFWGWTLLFGVAELKEWRSYGATLRRDPPLPPPRTLWAGCIATLGGLHCPPSPLTSSHHPLPPRLFASLPPCLSLPRAGV